MQQLKGLMLETEDLKFLITWFGLQPFSDKNIAAKYQNSLVKTIMYISNLETVVYKHTNCDPGLI